MAFESYCSYFEVRIKGLPKERFDLLSHAFVKWQGTWSKECSIFKRRTGIFQDAHAEAHEIAVSFWDYLEEYYLLGVGITMLDKKYKVKETHTFLYDKAKYYAYKGIVVWGGGDLEVIL